MWVRTLRKRMEQGASQLLMMIVTVGVRVIAGADWGCLLCQARGLALCIESIQASRMHGRQSYPHLFKEK